MTGVIPPQPGLNQARVEQLEGPTCSQAGLQASPYKRNGGGMEEGSGRRRARDEWHQTKVVRAGQAGWQDLQELRDRSGTEWAIYLTEEAYKLRKDPLTWTAQHFQKLFRETVVHEPARWSRFRGEGAPFTLEELRRVVGRGKTKKAVGLDLTSYELVKALCQDEVSEGSLLAWMQSVRKGVEIPKAWLTTIITLLPKKPRPESPSDMRPISLGSALGKVFGGLLLQRTRAVLRPKGPEQCALGGRQTADYLFSVFKTFAVETEWRFGLNWLKIDINKAYDSIHREKILEYLARELPEDMWCEFEGWRRLLGPGEAHVRTPWGCQVIEQTRGIRQGAVESPFIFAIAMECALHRAQQQPEWPSELSSAPDMKLASLLFMDDSILWDNRQGPLLTKYRLFKSALLEWGLTVNPKKTVFYKSPHSPEAPVIDLDGVQVQSSSTFEVMGVHLSVPLKPAAVMDTGMAKARKKYFASRNVLKCRGPLKKRLQVFGRGGPVVCLSGDAHPARHGSIEYDATRDGGEDVRPEKESRGDVARI